MRYLTALSIVIVLVVVVIVPLAFFRDQVFSEKESLTNQTSPAPIPTAIITSSPAPTLTPTPTPISTPTTAPNDNTEENPSGQSSSDTIPTSYELTLITNGEGTTNPSGNTTYTSGTVVWFTATPSSGWQFSNWSGSASGTQNPISITMNQNKTITANFIKIYALTTQVTGQGTINPTEENHNYPNGTVVTLSATANYGWRFLSWTGADNNTANPTTVAMNSNKIVTASFVKLRTLTITINGQGTTTPASGSWTYDNSVIVNLTAVASPGWRFASWTNTNNNTIDSTTVLLNADKTVKATFVEWFSLNASVTGQGSTNPSGVESYRSGTVVLVSAMPASGWRFTNWSGSVSGTQNPISITINANKTITANFVRTYNLTVNTNGQGTTSPAQTTTYVEGTVVNLSAYPSARWNFTSWNGTNNNNVNPTTVTMNSDRVVTANFLQILTLNISKTGQGSVTPAIGLRNYLEGANVSLTAVPAAGWRFDRWEGTSNNSANPSSVVMSSNKTVVAVFVKLYALNLIVNGNGTVTPPNGTSYYDYGTVVNLTASPNTNWQFDQWNGTSNDYTNSTTVVMQSDKTVIAFFAAPYKAYGIDFSPYTLVGQNPNYNVNISEQQILELLLKVKPYTNWVRTFGTGHGLEKIGPIAHQLNMKVAVQAWIGTDNNTNQLELTNLVNIARAGQADLLIVGSETLLRNDVTEAQLIGYIDTVKQAVPSINVTTADVYGELLAHPAVMNACDVIFSNFYPYWEGVNITYSMYHLNLQYQQVVAAAGSKPVIVAETGWPSAGSVLGDAVPSVDNARFYFLNFVSWARSSNVSYFYFEAFDEPWKTGEGSVGPYWGIWNSSSMKEGFYRVFDGETIADNWSGQDIGGPGTPSITFTYVPPYGSTEQLRGQVLHVKSSDYKVALYIKVGGGWWTKPFFNAPLTAILPDGSWNSAIVTGGSDRYATEIAAFVVNATYSPPLLEGSSALPAQLYSDSVANVAVTRPTT